MIPSVAFTQCGTLDNPQTDQSAYCSGDQMFLSIDGYNLEDETEIEWYYSTSSGFDPYNGGGTFIGDDLGVYNNCDEDPDVGSIMVDGCGTGPNGETNSEYVVIESGGGIYIDDFVMTLDDNNDGPPVNLSSPGTSACPWDDGYTAFVTGCSSVIAVGPGDFVPANSILIVQTSSDYSYTINANSASLCGDDGCIYVVRSTCNRTGFGAFSNSGSSALRSTDFDFGCNSVTITYDRADLGGSGTYIDGDEVIGSVPCAGIPSPGDISSYSVPTTFDDVSMVVPATWCGSTIYFKAIIDIDDVGDCCTEITSDEISITFNCPDANAAGPAEACEVNGLFTYDLTLFDATLSGGLGTVTWYTDAAASNMISNPTMHQTANLSVWAVVTIGGCDSAAEEVLLTQLASPTATQFDITGCTSLNPYNLDTDANPNINGTETITWFETDPSGGGAVQIGPPTSAVDLTSYQGGSIWAQVEDSNGCTTAIEVSVDADEIPEGCVGGALEICETGCETFTFTFTGGSGTYDAEVEFSFLGLPFGPFNFPAVTNSSGFTLCFDPNITIPTFSSGDITLPTCDPFGFICLGEGDIISLELISVVDANTGCIGTVGSGCIQSIEFHTDPDITVNQVDPTCFGETEGSIDLEISNGNPAYTFMWSNGLPNTEDQTNLGMGTYQVTVTDMLDCSATEEIVIDELDEITLMIIEMDETCEDDNDGAITVIPSDGIFPYLYDWDDNTYDGLDILTNLPDGSYTVTVTDDAGCTKEETITIQPGAMTVIPAFTISNVYCQNDLSDPLATVSDNGVSGSWSESDIDTDDAGVTLYTFMPDGGQCSNPIDINVTVVVEPILTIFDIECDGANYTFQVEVEGSPNTTYDLSGTSVIAPNSATIVTNGSGFGSESYTIPNSMTSVTLQVTLPTSPFCSSNVQTINSPTCDCPAVNIASLDQTLCYGEIPDLSDGATGFSIDSDPNGFAGDLVWTQDNLDPMNGGLLFTPSSQNNETCSPISFEIFAWLECEINNTIDSYVPSGSIEITVYPNQPILVVNGTTDPVCSGQANVVSYYLATADGTQCSSTFELTAEENLSCSLSFQSLVISVPFTEITDILGVPNQSGCTTYVNILDSESIDILPSGFTINTSGDGTCTDLIVDLIALDGTLCDNMTLACQDNTTTLNYDFNSTLGFTPSTDCTYDNLNGSLSCGSCGCSDPVMVDAGENQEICAIAGDVFDLTSLAASITGAVSDGLWLGGSGSYDSQVYSMATSYTISQADIDAGSILISLVSDVPAQPDCIAISDELTITFFPEGEDLEIMEMPCEDSGYTYTSPSGTIYDLAMPNGSENLLDDNGCAYTVSVTIDYQELPELTITTLECDVINDTYFVEFTLVGQIDNNDQGILGVNTVSNIPNGTPLVLEYSNNGLCQQTLTIPAPDCSCPFVAPAISFGDQIICMGDLIPTLFVDAVPGYLIDWYSDPNGLNFVASGYSYTPSTEGTYYVKTTDNLTGCESTLLTPVSLTIASPPMITTSATCSEDGLTYQIDFSISSLIQAEVTHSTGTLIDLGNDNYSIEGIDINMSVLILAAIPDVDCSSTLTVSPPQCDCPTVNPPVSLGDQVICSNESIAQLEVAIESGQEAYWYSDILLTDLINTGATYIPTAEGTYFVIAQDNSTGCESTESTTVSLEIVSPATLIGYNQMCSEDLSTYTATFTLSENQNFSVTSNAGLVSQLADMSYTLTEIPIAMSLIVTVSSDDIQCSEDYSFDPPNCNCPTIDPPIHNATEQYCIGDPIPSLSTMVANGMTPQWYSDATLTQLLSTDNPYTPDSPGIFYITAYDPSSDCQSAATQLTLIENALPVLNSFTAYCDEDDPNFYIVEFFQSSENTALLSAGSPITADGTFFIVNNIPIGEDLTIELTNTQTTCMNSVVIQEPICDCIDPPIISLASPGPICAGEVILLNAMGSGFTDSRWETTGDGVFENQFNQSATYTPGGNDIAMGMVRIDFIAEDPDGEGPCSEARGFVLVEIFPVPSPPVTETQLTYCKGETPDLLLPQGFGINWYDSNQNLIDPAPQVDTEFIGNTTYYVSEELNDCESELVEVTITVRDFSIEYETRSFCSPNLYTAILITNIQSDGIDYTIETNNYVYEISDNDIPFPIPYPLNTPISMVISDDTGCTIQIESAEVITSLSDASAIIIENSIDVNEYELSYDTELLESEIESIEWISNAELSCTDCENPEITLTQNETLVLVITTSDGCTLTTDINLVYQAPEVEVFIPNVFKPGSGDDNSKFYPQSKSGIGSLDRLSIYDRWGTLIYNTTQQELNDPTIGWDGTYRGGLSEQGVYVYAIEIRLENGETVIMAGDITLIR